MQYDFAASEPQHLYIELRAGTLDVTAAPVDRVTIEVTGKGADAVVVEQAGDRVSVIAPTRGAFFFQDQGVDVDVTAPVGSGLATKLGSATVRTQGALGDVHVVTGSGDVELDEVTGRTSVKSGSGSVTARTLASAAFVKAGSGTLSIGRLAVESQLVTGSGDIEVEQADQAVSLKSGSGDLTVHTASGGATMTTASGDLRVGRVERGRLLCKNASGDIRLGIPDGTPVWTDIHTSTGRFHSNLASIGAPQPGQDHVEVRAKSATGDIYLEQLTKEPS